MSTPILADALRALAAVRPSADVLLHAAADRLDAYTKMVELGFVLNSGHPVVTHEVDLTGVATERIEAAVKAATAALLPHSQDARKAAQQGRKERFMARLDAVKVAHALGAEPAGKAPKRAAAHMPRTPATSRTRKAKR